MSGVLFAYIARQILMGLAIAAGIVTTMIVLVDFVELSRSLGDAAGALTIAGLTLMRAPQLLETTLPFIVLFGVMWSMFQMNRRGELIIMRAAGVSAWRFAAPAVAITVALGTLSTSVLNPAAARLNDEFESRRDALQNAGGGRLNISEAGVWLRDSDDVGQIIVRAGRSYDRGERLENVSFFIYDRGRGGEPQFARRIDAERALLRPGFWQLQDAWETAPDVDPQPHAEIAVPTQIEPRRLLERFASPSALSFWELRRQAELLRRSGFAAVDYELRWHRLAATPVLLAAMTLLGAAVSLRLTRKGGAFVLVVAGAVFGFGLYFAESLLAALGATGVLPIYGAAWAAPLFALLGGASALAWMEDG